MFHSCIPRAPVDDRGTAPIVRHGRHALTVDIHCHYTSQRADDFALPHRKADSEAMLAFAGGQERAQHRQSISALDTRIRGTERRLAEMDTMGIDVQIVSPGPMQYFYWLGPELGREASRIVNDDIAEICARHPDRLFPMGTAPLQHPEFAVAELEYCVKKLGMRAMEINTNVNGTELAEAGLDTFFAKVEEWGIVLFIHPLGFTDGRRMAKYYFINSMGNPIESTLAVGHLIYGGVLDRHPGLKICVAHGGGYIAHYVGRLDHVYAHRPEVRVNMTRRPSEYMRQLYFDTVLYDSAEIEQLVKRWGPDHVLLGTDWPYGMSESDPIGLLAQCRAISPDERDKIAGMNAAKLFGLQVAARSRT